MRFKNKHFIENDALNLNNKVKRLYEVEYIDIDTEKLSVCRVHTYNALAATIITIKRLAKKGIEAHKIQILSTTCIPTKKRTQASLKHLANAVKSLRLMSLFAQFSK
jgi:hypothetical protein